MSTNIDVQGMITIIALIAGFGGMLNMMRVLNNNVGVLMKEVPIIDKELGQIKIRLDYIEEKVKTIAGGCPLLEAKSKRR